MTNLAMSLLEIRRTGHESVRRPILTTQKGRLINRATLNAINRGMTLEQIAQLERLRASSKSLHKAFKKEGYFR
jgi:hypothetical protein